jgi:hypothetical protein
VFAQAGRQSNEFSVHYGDGSATVGATTRVDVTAWHTYHLAWAPGSLRTWIDDGPPYFQTSDPAVLPDVGMDLAIQLDWFPQEGAAGGASMEVDYVRQMPVGTTPGA